MEIKESIQTYLRWKNRHTNKAYVPYHRHLKLLKIFLEEKAITRLETIHEDHIIEYHESMEEKEYSPATIAYSARIIRNFFKFWKGRGKSKLNPEEIKSAKFINAEKDIVTKEDFEQLIMVLDERYANELIKKLIIHLLWDTGMRISELLDIKLNDISKQGINGLRTAKVRTRKNMRYNLVVWGTDTNELLNQYLGMRLCMETENNYLFINPKTDKSYTSRSVQRWIKEITAMTLIDKNITPHSFRHGKANEILDQGGNVRDVSAILRHIAVESSMHYLQLSESRYKQTAGRFLKTA
ncbi:tyrosine recombinase XerD [Dokdonia pacifica]|uniref:Site-specific recombinase XerD n=1 Tax=Dokdonia pacifica TaxID=1627892 RepID=A0A239E989_9FLAO|nr:tyrosine-type recombinase/integrase [Dokdonia pacifica]GGG24981.1 tyrosine recombinase XerD [Dokdonia pacifica]SNS40444.1 Site-specific recombinase XerD [Dokdonia pacifica]